MPRAQAGEIERWLQDHDTDEVTEAPPIQDTWYEVFHAQDVRLIWCEVRQTNTETDAKDIEVRWTIDGNVYLDALATPHNTFEYVYRNTTASTGGTLGLTMSSTLYLAGLFTDKRGLDFKVEIRTTSVPGTNQVLHCRCVRETQEIT